MTTTNIQVLHVDDDNSFLTVSQSILQEEGSFSVDTAFSVDDALSKLKAGTYDVIVSDYEMPIKNGLDFLKIIRDNGSNIPFILFTGKGREEIVVKALNLGTDRYIDKHGDPQVVYTELSAAIRQLYEKTQATRKLWESEERFKKMVTSSKDMIMLTQTDGIILYVSPASKEILGYEPEELIGKNPWLIHPEDSERVQKIFQASLTTKASGKADYRIITKQGQTKWLHHSYSQIIENDKIIQVVSIVQDVTETKKAENELSVSEEKFSAAFNSSGAALALTRVSDGLFVEVNDCLLKLLGYTREEIIGKTTTELSVYANMSDREEILAILKNNQSVINREVKARKKDNTTATVLFSTKQINIKGQPHLLTTLIDISDLKRTEKALFLRQKELENFMSIAPDAVTIIGTDGKIVCCNDIAGQFFGYSPEEVIGRSGADFIVEEDREKLIRSFEEATKENQVKTNTYMVKQQNGRAFTAESSIKPIMDEAGKPSAYIAITRDITEKIAKESRIIELLEESKRRESNLKELIVVSESILRNCSIETVLERILGSFESIIHSESGIICLTGSEEAHDNAISHYKGNAYNRTGVPKNLLNVCQKICHSNQAVYINDLRDSPFVNLMKKLPFEVPSNGAIIPLKMKQNVGGYIVLANKQGGFNDNDLLIATLLAEFAVIALENNAAMEAVANSERQMRAITDSANDAIVMIDIYGKISFWSTAAVEMFGYTFEEARGKDFHLICTPERFHDAYALGFEAFRDTGKSFTLKKNLEFVAIRKNGEEFCAELSLSSFKLGTTWNAVGLIRDISERKKTEEKLKESEERYRFVAEHAQDIITVTDVNGTFQFVTPSIESVLGVKPGELIGKKSVLDFLSPQEIVKFNPKMEHLVKTGEVQTLEFHFTPNGRDFWLESRISLVTDEFGGMKFIAISRDITKRKRIEQKLRESEERYRFVADNAQDLITISDLQANFLYISPSIKHMFGYSPEDLVGKKQVFDLFHPDDISSFRNNIRILIANNSLPPVEFRLLTKAGVYVWLEAQISLVKDESGNNQFITISRDITQRKKDHEERDKALAQAELLLEKLSVVGGFVRHDIRNKLASITNTLYLSKKSANNNELMLAQVNQISATTKNIVRILDFSQTYEAVGSQGLYWIKVAEAVEEAQALFAGSKDLQIAVENIDFEVLADSALTEIFHNLIDNSLKYGQNLTQIKISAEKTENDGLQLIYEDNGGGIDAKIKPSLFQKGAGKGTGLGLYLIQRICDVYGWKVQEKGESGRGVLFIFEIPQENTRIEHKA